MKIKPLARPGFTMFNNYVLDHFMPGLSANGWKVLCSAIRRTIGWADEETSTGRREEVAISYDDFMKDTGIRSRSTVAAAVYECLEKQVLIRAVNPAHKQGFLYKLNTDLEVEEDEPPPAMETGTEIGLVEQSAGTGTETGLVHDETGTETGLVHDETGPETGLDKIKGEKGKGEKKDMGTAQLDPLSFELERRTAKGQSNWAVPLDAGGDDAWSNGPVDSFARLVGLNPADLPKKKRLAWAKELRGTAGQWSTEDRAVTAEDMQQGIDALVESRYGWKTFSSPFEQGFKNAIGVVILGGGQVQEKPQANVPARRYQAPAGVMVRH